MKISKTNEEKIVDAVDFSKPFLKPVIDTNIGPLISAMAQNKAVIYVGAGASIPAGLPSWDQFLRRCLSKAKAEPGNSDAKWQFTEDLLGKHGDLTSAAELLQLGLGNALERYIWDEFGSAIAPSPVHHALARLPSSIAITVNYDRLLESAYRDRPNVWTWRDPDAFFSAIRNRRFAIIKTHGDVGNSPSLVLTRTQYRDLIHQNEAFNACFRTLLSHRTFLFVGTSLRDPDLINLLDTAKLSLGPEFGPHFAILFDDEIDAYFSQHLLTSYNINVIICDRKSHQSNCSLAPQQGSEMLHAKWCRASRCRAVVRTLTEISGMASRRLAHSLPSPGLDDPTFSLFDACQRLLQNATKIMGSFRSDLCLIDCDGRLRVMHKVAEVPLPQSADPCDPDSLQPKSSINGEDNVQHNTVIGGLYLREKIHDDFLYVSDIANAPKWIDGQGFSGISYKSCHPDVQSELAVPIRCDGQRVGVLNFESELPDAFTQDHLEVAFRVASTAGWIFNETRQRQHASRGFLPYFNDPSLFRKEMCRSRLLQHHLIEFILWKLDYASGIATPRSSKPTDGGEDLSYSFFSKSLVTEVLRTRRAVHIRDAQRDALRPEDVRIVAKKGLDLFGIHGPVSGIPIQRDGTTCAILVAWSDRYSQADETERAEIRAAFQGSHRERIFRWAQLLANDPELAGKNFNGSGSELDSRTMLSEPGMPNSAIGASSFIGALENALAKYDKGKDDFWIDRNIRRDHRRNRRRGVYPRRLTPDEQLSVTRSLLQVLVSPHSGIQRVRLWLPHGKDGFALVQSACTAESESFDPKRLRVGQGTKIAVRLDDPYVHYTMTRFANDPYARLQHRSMFGIEDQNNLRLHKDPDGSWIVGPISRNKGKLLGFLSVDNHRPVVNRERPESDTACVFNRDRQLCIMHDDTSISREMQIYQQCTVDVVTDILSWVIDERFPKLRAISELRRTK